MWLAVVPWLPWRPRPRTEALTVALGVPEALLNHLLNVRGLQTALHISFAQAASLLSLCSMLQEIVLGSFCPHAA